MPVATYYIDANRGSDTNDGLSKASAFKSLSKVNGLTLGPGSAILLASDSTFLVEHSSSVSGKVDFSNFNGSSVSRNYIGAYDFAGATGTKPTITHRMVPQSSDWAWDGTKSAWYIQLSISTFLTRDCWVKVAGQWAETTNQDAEDINATHNGMTTSRLRFNADTVQNRFYLAWGGANSGTNPSVYFGAGQIVLGLGSIFGAWNGLQQTTIDGLQCVGGGGLLYLYAGGAGLLHRGLEIKNCVAQDTNSMLTFGTYSLDAASSLLEIQYHDNIGIDNAGWCFSTYGNSLNGDVYNNKFYGSNRCHALGGSVYVQNKQNDALGTRLRVRHNFATNVRNGTGNCSFDGCGFYADNYDDGTLFYGNVVTDCFKAYQTNNGRRSTFVGNVAYNCDTFITATDASQNNASDYLIANNLIYQATGNTRPHGNTATSLQPIGAWRDGSSMVAAKIVNNIIIGSGDFSKTRPGIYAYNDADWSAGKVTVANNHVSGCSSSLVSSASSDKTSVASCITAVPSFTASGDADFRPAQGSSALSSGVDAFFRSATDQYNKPFQSPPSIGPIERITKDSWF